MLDKHWWTIVGQTLANEGIITLRESYGPRIPAQIVLHREITWKALQDSPAYEGRKAYRYLKDLLADYQKIYAQEIKDELYHQFIENN